MSRDFFWTLLVGSQDFAWCGAVRVDGVTYQILGVSNLTATGFQLATQTGADFTATRTSFALECGPVNVNMTFLSPVEVCVVRLPLVCLVDRRVSFGSLPTWFDSRFPLCTCMWM